jgi:hypothetical protein
MPCSPSNKAEGDNNQFWDYLRRFHKPDQPYTKPSSLLRASSVPVTYPAILERVSSQHKRPVNTNPSAGYLTSLQPYLQSRGKPTWVGFSSTLLASLAIHNPLTNLVSFQRTLTAASRL